MKDLDKNKAYDLRGLSNEQLREVFNWLKDNDYGWENITWLKEQPYIYYNSNRKEWLRSVSDLVHLDSTNAITLFEPNNLEDLGFESIGHGFYSIHLGRVEISVRKNVYVEDCDGIVELFKYDFEKVKKLVELWK